MKKYKVWFEDDVITKIKRYYGKNLKADEFKIEGDFKAKTGLAIVNAPNEEGAKDFVSKWLISNRIVSNSK